MEIPFQEDVLNDIVEKAKDYCLMHGTIKKVLPLVVSGVPILLTHKNFTEIF